MLSNETICVIFEQYAEFSFKGTAEMHLAKLLHHKSDFEVVPDIKETADKQMPRRCLDLSWSCHQMKTTK